MSCKPILNNLLAGAFLKSDLYMGHKIKTDTRKTLYTSEWQTDLFEEKRQSLK